jgi:hypothetical protein
MPHVQSARKMHAAGDWRGQDKARGEVLYQKACRRNLVAATSIRCHRCRRTYPRALATNLHRTVYLPVAGHSEPKWRNGRRGGLKNLCPHGRVGSSPTFGTQMDQPAEHEKPADCNPPVSRASIVPVTMTAQPPQPYARATSGDNGIGQFGCGHTVDESVAEPSLPRPEMPRSD